MALNFLRHLIGAVPYKVRTVHTHNGTHLTPPGTVASAASIIREAIAAGESFRAHCFELATHATISTTGSSLRATPGPTVRSIG